MVSYGQTYYTGALQVFVNKCLRHILGVFWPNIIENKELWRIIKFILIKTQIKRRKWQWIGHTLRKPEGDIVGLGLESTMKKKKGRPKVI